MKYILQWSIITDELLIRIRSSTVSIIHEEILNQTLFEENLFKIFLNTFIVLMNEKESEKSKTTENILFLHYVSFSFVQSNYII